MNDISADLERILYCLEELDLLCRKLPNYSSARYSTESLRSRQVVAAICGRVSFVHTTISRRLGALADDPDGTLVADPADPISFPVGAILPSERAWLRNFSDPPSPGTLSCQPRDAYSLSVGFDEENHGASMRQSDDHDAGTDDSRSANDVSGDDDSGTLGGANTYGGDEDVYCDDTQNKDSPLEPTDPAEAKPDDSQDAVLLRTGRILRILDDPTISMDELANVLLGGEPKTRLGDLEDAAFSRLFCSLPSVSVDDWSEAFGDHAHNIVTVGQIIVHSKARDEVDGDTLRLQARHHAISEIQSGSATSNAITRILLQIETIKFASEWQDQISSKGSRKSTSAFYKAAFICDSDFAHHFHGLVEPAVESKLKELTSDYNKWRNKVGKVVTARNRLLRLYDMFGPAVPLDPQWDVQQLVYGRSRLFIPVWNALYYRIREENLKLPSQRRVKQTLVCIMTALGGEPVANYISKFLEDYQPCPKTLKETA